MNIKIHIYSIELSSRNGMLLMVVIVADNHRGLTYRTQERAHETFQQQRVMTHTARDEGTT